MKRLRNKDVERVQNNVGEVNCLRWKDLLFSWKSCYSDGVDEYLVEGPFSFRYDPRKVYDQLIIKADWTNKTFFLKTGKAKQLTWINLLDV